MSEISKIAQWGKFPIKTFKNSKSGYEAKIEVGLQN